jgi:DNA primase catalytic subunit
MQDETIRKASPVIISDNDELQLTADERRLILNFRTVRACAQEMLVDLSAQYKRTMPAEAVGA